MEEKPKNFALEAKADQFLLDKKAWKDFADGTKRFDLTTQDYADLDAFDLMVKKLEAAKQALIAVGIDQGLVVSSMVASDVHDEKAWATVSSEVFGYAVSKAKGPLRD